MLLIMHLDLNLQIWQVFHIILVSIFFSRLCFPWVFIISFMYAWCQYMSLHLMSLIKLWCCKPQGVYERSIQSTIAGVIQGLNATVFAYGSTGRYIQHWIKNIWPLCGFWTFMINLLGLEYWSNTLSWYGIFKNC